ALAACGLVFSCSMIKNNNAAPGGQKAAAPDQPAAEKVLFYDDFSGSKLDRNKWNVEITGFTTNDEQQAYVDSSATAYIVHGAEAEGAANGALVLQPRYSPGFKTPEGHSFDFISARINTRNKVDFAHGSASARIKITDAAGLWPAWWLLGKGDWPKTGEIDIMEYVGEGDWASAAIHGPGYSGETPFVNRFYFPGRNDITHWHVYAVDWTDDSLVFKYDGVPMFRVTRPMIEHYGKWTFDNEEFLVLNFALGGGYPAKINGIKTPYYGLPAATVEAIKSNRIKLMVDWVKVVKH
ncbi:MAG TPA: glycoside hydrolase family 16 protein, partial [Puia sp.]|nr:glycoside hydrolase family 16 protein [Puia sp.]